MHDKLVTALRIALRPYQNGVHYEGKNPYMRPYVKHGLKLLAEEMGVTKDGAWMDINDTDIEVPE